MILFHARLFKYSRRFLTLVVVACATWMSAVTKSNIVFILADDLDGADVAFHGGNVLPPNLDWRSPEGRGLMQHHVAAKCSPTHGMPQRTGHSKKRPVRSPARMATP